MKLAIAAPALASVLVATLPAATANDALRGSRILGNGRPSNIVTEDGDIHPSPEDDCTILAADHLMIPEGHEGHVHRSLQDGDFDLEFGCGFPDGTIADMEVTPAQQAELGDAMTKGAIRSGEARIDLGKAGAQRNGSKVSFNPGFSVVGNAHGKGKANNSGGSNSQGQGGGSANAASSRRNLAQLVGNKYTLIVVGRFVDYPFNSKSASLISDDVFGTSGDPVNLKSQLYDCSYGQLVTIPGPDPSWNGGALTNLEGIEAAPGVLEINMGVNMSGMTKSDIYNLFVTKTIEALGSAVTGLPGPFDHVVFARESCLTECGWAAYAYINSWGQMFQGRYISETGVQVHEMGHALNLAHSGSNGITWSGGSVGSGGYTDHTCQMGNPLYSDDIGKMCFNPAKNYQIDGWYNDAKLTLDPAGLDGPADALPYWEGDVIGVGEYNLRTDQPVTIKIETGTPQDIFVGFNRAAGPNAQNDLADNKVNVIQVEGNDGTGYSQSRLIALLEPGSSYSELAVPGIVDYADLKIKVNSIGTASAPWKAHMRIGFDQCPSHQFCQDYAGGCFTSSCLAQGTPGTNLLGCSNEPILNCCGNDICESEETKTSCPADCYIGPITFQPDDCASCWIRNGAMFDVEAKPNAAIEITGVEYKAYTATGNVRLYYRIGGKTGYASGASLLSNGWIFVTESAACGAWKYCSISGVSINVPKGTRVGLLVAYDNGGDVLYYNTNYGPTSDDYIKVHEGTAVDFNLAGGYANNFHNALMFSGKVNYMADLTGSSQCTVDADCDDDLFCNGAETCVAGSCQPGTAPSCSAPNDKCSEALESCVACLTDGDCADEDLCNGIETCNASGTCDAGSFVDCDDSIECTTDFCTPSTGLCTNSPNHFHCDDGVFCNGAETCDALAGCLPATNPDPCSGSAPFCDEAGDQCLECLSDGDCEDNDLCTGIDTCNAGVCQGGTSIDCDDSVSCTTDTCNPTTGACSNTASDALCDDDLFCNGDETCDADNGCQAGTPPTCSVPNDMCSNAVGACVSCLSDENCDDGEFCNGLETCNASGSCVGGVAPGCSGLTPFCSELLDQCTECRFDGDCNDDVACTDDVCSESSCTSTANDANCPEGEICSASAGCLVQRTVYACAKWAPTTAEACAAGSNANCDANPNAECGNGGKTCHQFTCVGVPGSCQEGGSCSGKCDDCCCGYSGSGGSKTCKTCA